MMMTGEKPGVPGRYWWEPDFKDSAEFGGSHRRIIRVVERDGQLRALWSFTFIEDCDMSVSVLTGRFSARIDDSAWPNCSPANTK